MHDFAQEVIFFVDSYLGEVEKRLMIIFIVMNISECYKGASETYSTN